MLTRRDFGLKTFLAPLAAWLGIRPAQASAVAAIKKPRIVVVKRGDDVRWVQRQPWEPVDQSELDGDEWCYEEEDRRRERRRELVEMQSGTPYGIMLDWLESFPRNLPENELIGATFAAARVVPQILGKPACNTFEFASPADFMRWFHKFPVPRILWYSDLERGLYTVHVPDGLEVPNVERCHA